MKYRNENSLGVITITKFPYNRQLKTDDKNIFIILQVSLLYCTFSSMLSFYLLGQKYFGVFVIVLK
jgi:excinuclease UvrABC nuclease subunit